MSGLEPLAALSLSCQVIQLTGVVKHLIILARNIYDSGTPDPGLDVRVQDMTKICDELQTQRRSCAGRPSTPEEQELMKIAKRTLGTAAELRKEVDRLSGSFSSQGKCLPAMGGTLKLAWHRKKLDRMEQSMLDGQRVMETRLLMRVCSQNDARALQEGREFSTLGTTLQGFISAYSQGKTSSDDLVRTGFKSVENRIGADGDQTRQHISEQVSTDGHLTRQQILTRVDELKVGQSDQLVEKFLASLRYPTMNERRNQVSDSHDKTFDWIFGSKFNLDPSHKGPKAYFDFTAWLRSADQPLFWISGKPGSGKSTLIKFLLEDTRTRKHLQHKSPNTLLISHFIWSAGGPMQGSLKGLLCSLLHQVIAGHPKPSDILAKIPKFSKLKLKETHSDWSNKELEGALFWILGNSMAPVCIFIDGLDEIDKKDGPFALLDVAKHLSELPPVKVCVSSRPEPILQKRLSVLPMIKVQDFTRKDISTFARGRLSSFVVDAEYAFEPAVVDQLADELALRADGVFLWVSLALKSIHRGIANGDSQHEVLKRLNSLPDDLNALYKDMWNRLNADKDIYREDAAGYLNMALHKASIEDFDEVLYALEMMLAVEQSLTRKLTKGWGSLSKQDMHAILFTKVPSFVKSIEVRSAGLLEVHGKDPRHATVSLVHRSAKEFLCGTSDGQQLLGYDKSTQQNHEHNLDKAGIARLLLFEREWLLDGARCADHGDHEIKVGPHVPKRSREDLHTTIAELIGDACRLRLSTAERMEVLQAVESLQLQSAHGASYPLPDFIASVANRGYKEFVSSAVSKAESIHGPLSAAYRTHLMRSALTIPSIYSGDGLSLIAFLLQKATAHDINARAAMVWDVWYLPQWDTFEPSLPLFDAFLTFLIVQPPETTHWSDGLKALEIVKLCQQFLHLGARLDHRSVLTLTQTGRGGWAFASRWHVVDGDSQKPFATLDVDTKFLLKVVSKMLLLNPTSSESQTKSAIHALQKQTEGPAPSVVRILGLGLKGQLAELAPINTALVTLPTDEQESEFIRAVEEGVWKPAGGGSNGIEFAFRMPGNTQRLFEGTAPGARTCRLEELELDLEHRGLLYDIRRLTKRNWPPPRHISEQRGSASEWDYLKAPMFK